MFGIYKNSSSRFDCDEISDNEIVFPSFFLGEASSLTMTMSTTCFSDGVDTISFIFYNMDIVVSFRKNLFTSTIRDEYNVLLELGLRLRKSV